MAAITEACHASEPSGYCPGKVCGTSNAPVIKYPFRLVGDATNNNCYTNFTDLHFVCLNTTLYLNISSIPFSYQVLDINYINQTLVVQPVSNSWCRPFDPNDFVPLNVTNISGTPRSVLECNTSISPNCTYNNSISSSSPCSGSHVNYNCPFQPGKYENISCYLDQSNTTKIQLGWQGSSSSMFQNLIYHIICFFCCFWFGL